MTYKTTYSTNPTCGGSGVEICVSINDDYQEALEALQQEFVRDFATSANLSRTPGAKEQRDAAIFAVEAARTDPSCPELRLEIGSMVYYLR